ncbi:hypothetical protein AAIE21_12370 [Paenibacillus sp. 102]|uniref:hypothetical protein n=1 Tax=Paenibacillus sp. 102 TaxID=3120823 RepID=UPI0031BA72E1
MIQKGMFYFDTKEFSVHQEVVGNHFNARDYGELGVILSWVTDTQEVTGIYIPMNEIDKVVDESYKFDGKETYIINTKSCDYRIIQEN